jgi:hypothetical protein
MVFTSSIIGLCAIHKLFILFVFIYASLVSNVISKSDYVRFRLTVTRLVSLMGQELHIRPKHVSYLPIYCGIRVAQYLGFCVVFYRSLFILIFLLAIILCHLLAIILCHLLAIILCHLLAIILCHSPIYGFWLTLRYLQTFLDK